MNDMIAFALKRKFQSVQDLVKSTSEESCDWGETDDEDEWYNSSNLSSPAVDSFATKLGKHADRPLRFTPTLGLSRNNSSSSSSSSSQSNEVATVEENVATTTTATETTTTTTTTITTAVSSDVKNSPLRLMDTEPVPYTFVVSEQPQDDEEVAAEERLNDFIAEIASLFATPPRAQPSASRLSNLFSSASSPLRSPTRPSIVSMLSSPSSPPPPPLPPRPAKTQTPNTTVVSQEGKENVMDQSTLSKRHVFKTKFSSPSAAAAATPPTPVFTGQAALRKTGYQKNLLK